MGAGWYVALEREIPGVGETILVERKGLREVELLPAFERQRVLRQISAYMIERKDGRLITIISDAGRWGDAGLEIYAGAKAGAAMG